MKRIGIDARMWFHPGIGRYLRETSLALLSRPSEFKFIFFGPSTLRPELNRFPTADFRETASPIYSLREQWELALRSRSVDVFHVPHFNIPFFHGERLVVTVHDLLYLHDRTASRSRWGRPYVNALLKRVARTARAVIAVSEFTKKDLLKNFPSLDPNRVFVIHEAASEFFKPVPKPEAEAHLRRRFALEGPFVLFVGTLKPHKNLKTLAEAMRSARSRGVREKLVVVGRADPKAPEAAESLSGDEGACFLGEVADEDLRMLYGAATVFVLPSLWEGFGIPVLEAMACGAPVISSNAASLPEAAGDAAELFSPLGTDALERLLVAVLSDPSRRAAMSQKSLTQAARFSWERTAERTLAVYREALR